ncbi:MAG: hypothetical protein IJX99_05865 [Clostridia bacterium]|nr:hypothetical protein [Clostridia bacterium]
MNILLFLLIGLTVYLLIEKIRQNKILERINQYINNKNELYYKEFLKKYEKSKKIKLVDKLNVKYKISLLIERANINQNILINPISLILYGIVCVFSIYALAFNVFKVHGIALIISIPCIIIPFVIIKAIISYKSQKMEKVFLNFLLQLKNYTKISNDVVGAFQNIETVEPLQSYIRKFNIELNSGVKFETAIEHLKEKVGIVKFKEFFSNVQYCYLYGGNFSSLIEKSYKSISEIQKEKAKRLEETRSARLVLIILMLLNIIVYITYVRNNVENYLIMKNSVFGLGILYWNFISMWILIYLSEKVKQLDY